MNWLADTIGSHRRLAWALVVLATAAAIIGVTRLDYAELRDEARGKDSGYASLEELYREFGSEDLDCVLLVKGQDVFAPTAVAALRRLQAEIQGVDGVLEVYGLNDILVISDGIIHSLLPEDSSDEAELEQARRAALKHPLVAGHLLSPDASVTLIIVRLDSNLRTVPQLLPVVGRIRQAMKAVASHSGLEVLLTGLPVLRVDFFESLEWRKILKFIILSITITFTTALLLFRKLSALVMVAAPPLWGVLLTMGGLGWLGLKATGVSCGIPTLIFVIGFTDAVHLMIRLRREVAGGMSAGAAALSAVRHSGMACALTSLTTGAGFGSLVLASSYSVRNFGVSLAFGCALMFLAVILLVPLLAATPLGRRSAAGARPLAEDRWAPLFHWAARRVLAHPGLVALLSVLLTAALVATGLRLRPDTTPAVDLFPPQSEFVRANEILDRDFGGGQMVHVIVDWRGSHEDLPEQLLPALQAVQAILREDPFTVHPISALDLLESIGAQPREDSPPIGLLSMLPPDLVRRFIRFDHRHALVSARVKDVGAAVSIPAFSRLEQELAALSRAYEGIQFTLTGTSLVALRTLHTVTLDFAKSMGLAVVTIFGMIMLAFRSIRYGLVSVIPNIFPLAVLSAFLVWTGQTLQESSAIFFAVCLGIAVDDTIHLLTSFRRELADHGEAQEAVRRSLVAVGKALLTTTVIFVVGFGTLMLHATPVYRLFASLACVGFSAALAGDLVILPALLVCFCRSGRR